MSRAAVKCAQTFIRLITGAGPTVPAPHTGRIFQIVTKSTREFQGYGRFTERGCVGLRFIDRAKLVPI